MVALGNNGRSVVPNIGREGVYFHQPSGQFVSRLGFELNRAGKRVRAFRYLGNDPEEATLRHVAVVREWKFMKAHWAQYRELIRLGLPDKRRTRRHRSHARMYTGMAAHYAAVHAVTDSKMRGIGVDSLALFPWEEAHRRTVVNVQ